MTNPEFREFSIKRYEGVTGPPPGYELIISIGPSGAGYVIKVPDMDIYPAGTVVQLFADPAAGYEFDSWQWDASGTEPVYVTMDSNKLVQALFKELEVPPFDPWSYDFDGDGYINWAERGAATQHQYMGIITQEQLDMVLALPEAPPIEALTLVTLLVNLSPYPASVTIEPFKTDYEAGETVTITANISPAAEPDQGFQEWIIVEQGQWPDGEVGWNEQETAWGPEGYYTWRRSSSNPLFLSMRARTWIRCIVGLPGA